MNLVLVGPPGCGKGTQAVHLVNKYGMRHVSTGNMLRDAVKAGTELGRQVEAVMAAGELVTDELIIGLIREFLDSGDAAKGWLMDGFPRTVPQAEALIALLDEAGQAVDAVVEIAVPDNLVVRRLAGRLTCKACSHTTATGAGGLQSGDACPACGKGELYVRDDDSETTVRSRLDVYHRSTAPVIEVLAGRYPLKRVDGTGAPSEVTVRLYGVLG